MRRALHASLFPVPLGDFDRLVRDGELCDARTIAAVRLAGLSLA